MEFVGDYLAHVNTTLSDSIGGVDENVALLKINLDAEELNYRIFDTNARENAVSMFMGMHNRLWTTAQTQSIDYLFNLQMLLLSSLPSDIETDASIVQLPSYRGLMLFPNPVNNNFNFELHDSHLETKATWEIIDLTGKKILYGQSQISGFVSADKLPNGIYYFRLKTNKGIYVNKFVKI